MATTQRTHLLLLQGFPHSVTGLLEMRLSFRAGLVAVLLMSAWVLGASSALARKRPRTCVGANLLPTSANTATVSAATLCLIDQVRASHRLRPLRANRELQWVAAAQAHNMVRGDYFADNPPSGLSLAARIVASRYLAHAATFSTAQNIGWGTITDATPARMLEAWMLSPPHRQVILTGAFRDAGVGVVPAVPSVVGGGLGGATWAVEFGIRLR
jgi:uncharacterized protein YkwD